MSESGQIRTWACEKRPIGVNAGNSNGRTNWKVADTGETYQQWHGKKLGAAKVAGPEPDE